MAHADCAGTHHREADPPGDQGDGRHFEFPDIGYSREDRGDPLCAAGLERNARDLGIALERLPRLAELLEERPLFPDAAHEGRRHGRVLPGR